MNTLSPRLKEHFLPLATVVEMADLPFLGDTNPKKKPSNSLIPAQERFARLSILAIPLRKYKLFFEIFMLTLFIPTLTILAETPELSSRNLFGGIEVLIFFALAAEKTRPLGPRFSVKGGSRRANSLPTSLLLAVKRTNLTPAFFGRELGSER
jgi:hypothetical protein